MVDCKANTENHECACIEKLPSNCRLIQKKNIKIHKCTCEKWGPFTCKMIGAWHECICKVVLQKKVKHILNIINVWLNQKAMYVCVNYLGNVCNIQVNVLFYNNFHYIVYIMETIIIFPNSLFEDNKLINKNTEVYIIEHSVYFTLFTYHKMKLILHRSTMRQYADYIKKKYKCTVNYIDYKEADKKLEQIFKSNKKIDLYDPVDHVLMKEIKSLTKKYKTDTIVHNTPLFLSTLEDLQSYKKKNNNYVHNSFYIWQRKRLDILVTKDKKPQGGKWSYDVENRKPFPDNFDKKNKVFNPKKVTNKYIKEATIYVNKYFSNNPGDTDFYLPIDHSGAKRHLTKFMKDRFKCFGPYQDAVHQDIPFGCHSVISPLLNVGLLTPKYVVDQLQQYGKKYKVPLQSLEAIIRQIVGWREYVRMLYMFDRKTLESKNYFKHKNKLKDFWYDKIEDYKNGSGFQVIDDMINKAIKHGYLHHIERLMYIGNFMLINKIKPIDVFKWFMEMFIDSYNWVMYANVYGMSQHSTGPLMMTRPYFSSSSYIARMSNYDKKKNKYEKIKLNEKEYEWFEVWDALYYNFIADNTSKFSKNYAISNQVNNWNNKSVSDKKEIKNIAKDYMKKY